MNSTDKIKGLRSENALYIVFFAFFAMGVFGAIFASIYTATHAG